MNEINTNVKPPIRDIPAYLAGTTNSRTYIDYTIRITPRMATIIVI